MKRRTWLSVLGVGLIAAGLAGWFWLPERGEVVVILLLILGGFFISRTGTADALKALGRFLGRDGDG